jgi:hypothetical protein
MKNENRQIANNIKDAFNTVISYKQMAILNQNAEN